MSAWGNKDDVASPGTVAVSGVTITGTDTFFANNLTSGMVISVADLGSGVVNVITNETSMTITTTAEMTDGTGKEYTVSEKPISVVDTDTNTLATEVFGVSVAEQGVATANTHHAGWVKIGDRYTDGNGNVRQKSEVLVAMSTIAGDAADDGQLPDA
tara:strand:+ start:3696 stop:4166 length:471 start_codon:yes stop_codon:yes gene_type:complete